MPGSRHPGHIAAPRAFSKADYMENAGQFYREKESQDFGFVPDSGAQALMRRKKYLQW